MKVAVCRLTSVVVSLVLLNSCGGGTGGNRSIGTGTPSFTHVAVVVLENQDFSNIIGNVNMPFLNSLASQNSLARQYFANTHPSIGNYFMMTTGQIITNDDASTCTLADKATNTDAWLQNNLSALLANSDFQSNGFLVITFDESETDNTNGGGRVATVLVGPRVKQAFVSDNTYQHQSLLRTALESLGVTTLPGAASGAASMSE